MKIVCKPIHLTLYYKSGSFDCVRVVFSRSIFPFYTVLPTCFDTFFTQFCQFLLNISLESNNFSPL